MESEGNEVRLWPIQLDSFTAKPAEYPVVSYGTFFPPLPKHWLEASSESKSSEGTPERNLELSSASFGSGGFCYPVEGRITRQISRGSESGFESDYTRSGVYSRRASLSISPLYSPSPTPLRTSPVPEANTAWVDTLFREMDKRISKAEEELSDLHKSEDEGFSEEDLDQSRTVVSINSDEDDYHTIEIREQYKSDEDHLKYYRSAFGVLCRLKGVLVNECARLDRLVGMDRSEDDEAVKELITTKSGEFRARLCSDLDDVGSAISKIREKKEMMINGVRFNRGSPESSVLKEVKHSKITCRSWLHVILLGAVMTILSFMYLWNLKSKDFDRWVLIVRLVRSPLIVVFLFYLYAVNMKVWAKYNINYVAIFNHHPDSTPTPARILTMADFLTIAISVLVIAVIMASPFSSVMPIKVLTLVMWGCLLVFLLSPFQWFQRKMRFKFISVLIHILMAPFVYVFFTDFYLADQFNSIVAIFLDMHYSMCYIFNDSWSSKDANTKICTSSGNGIRPIISFLPAMWRMLQCFRCFYNTLSVRHLVNAGKYFTTFPVIVFATLYSVRVKGDIFESSVNEGTSWLLVMWAVSAIIHSGYTFLWDVCVDWGLWDIIKCKTFQRELLFKRKSVYIAAIIFDLILRFTWTLKLSLAIVWQVDSDLLYTGNVLFLIVVCALLYFFFLL